MLQKDQTPTLSTLINKYVNPRTSRRIYMYFWMYAAILVMMNLTPGSTRSLEMKEILFVRSDYFYHAAAYLLLAGLLVTASISPRPVFRNNMILWGLLVLSVLASVPEVLQQFVPNRRFNWWDMTANFTGLGLGSILTIPFFKIFFKKNLI